MYSPEKSKIKLLFLIGLLFFSFSAQAQYSSKKDLIENAQKLFDDGDYAKAMPLYAQLVSLNTKNAIYSYRYAVCNLKAGDNKEKSISYLKFSAGKKDVPNLDYYYLGRAYHLNYYFNDAIAQYKKYKSLASPKDIQKYDIDLKIKMCQNGLRLLSHINDVKVIGKKIVPINDFFRAYSLSDIGGQIVVIPDEIKSKYDKKYNNHSVIYIPNNSQVVYYASYTADGTKDIFRIKRLPDGKWSSPYNIGKPVNTAFDEDYPFYNESTHTLYFCSKAHNSMGGYDIFKSQYDPNTNTYNPPTNLDFSFSSVADDYLFITDPAGQLAYFTSDRNQGLGKVAVYHVKVEPSPAKFIVIKGKFIDESDTTFKTAKIDVTYAETNKSAGEFIANKNTGNYVILIPGSGGKYKFAVSSTIDAPIHQGIVNVPREDSIVALRQELDLVGEGDNQKLIIKNFFDQKAAVNMADPAIAQAIKERSYLNVNATKQQVLVDLGKERKQVTNLWGDTTKTNNTENKPNTENTNNPVKNSNLNNEQLVVQAQKQQDSLSDYIKKLTNQTNAAYFNASTYAAKAKGFNEKAKKINQQIASGTFSDKSKAFSQEVTYKKKASENANKAASALKLAKGLGNELNERQADLGTVSQLSSAIKVAISANNRAGALEKFNKQQKNVATIKQTPTAIQLQQEDIQRKLKKQQKITTDADADLTDLQKQQSDIDNQIKVLQGKLNNTKKKKDKEAITQQINTLNIDKDDIDYQLTQAKAKADKANQKEEQIQMASQMLTDNTTQLNQPETNYSKGSFNHSQDQTEAIENNLNELKDDGLVGKTPDQIAQGMLIANNNNTTNPSDTLKAVGFSSGKNTNQATNETATQTSQPLQVGITDQNGKIVDFGTKYQKQLTDLDTISNPAAKDSAKNKVYNQWVKTMKEDISIKKMAFVEATDSAKKQQLGLLITQEQNKINAKQQTIDSIQKANNQLANNVTNTTNNQQQLTENTEPNNNTTTDTTNNHQLSTINHQPTTTNPEKIVYSNAFAQQKMSEADNLDSSAEKLNLQAEQKRIAANQTSDAQEKQQLLADAKNLENEAKQNQLQAVTKRISANNKQFDDNANKLQALTNATQNSDNTKSIMAAMQAKDANYYHNQAQTNQSGINQKQPSLNDITKLKQANATEEKALKKQSQALQNFQQALGTKYDAIITQAATQQNNSSKNQNENLTENNNNQLTENTSENTTQNTQNEPQGNLTENNESQNQTPSTDKSIMQNFQQAAGLKKQAQILKLQADSVQKIADNTRKKKTKAQLQAKADSLNRESKQKIEMVTVLYEKNDSLNKAATQKQAQDIAEKAKNKVDSSLEISDEEKSTINSLSNSDINKYTASTEYKIYADKKESSRRLIKTAEVQYETAAKLKDEAQQDQQLQKSLIALQTMAKTPADKQKDSIRIALLKTLSAIKQQQADSLQNLAKQNLDSGRKDSAYAQTILQGSGNDASTIAAIEKMDAVNPTFVSNAQSQARLAQNNTTQQKDTTQTQNPETNTNIPTDTTNNQPQLTENNPTTTQTQNTETNTNVPADTTGNQPQLTENNTTQQENTQPNNNTKTDTAINQQPSTNNQQQITPINNFAPTENKNIRSLAQNFSAPNQLSKPIFIISPSKVSAYNNATPIPVAKKEPEGLVFKVQIGAFRDPIPENLFKGFAPIMKKRGADGITRYWAGFFRVFKTADYAKTQIRQIGYRDAFVVAFYNGKRISIKQAQALLAAKPNSSNQQPTTSNHQPTTNNQQPIINNQPPVNDGVSQSVNSVKGIFYTVQVGVYSKPIKGNALSKIRPLNNDRTANGFIRYTTGVYRNLDAAKARKAQVSPIVHDAFVTAYYQGKRIPVSKALALQQQQKATTQENNVSNTDTTTENNNETEQQPSTNNQIVNQNKTLPTDTSTNPAANQNVVYKVKLGAFTTNIPNAISAKYLSLGSKIESTKKDGTTLYTVGNFTNPDDANKKCEEIKAKGIANAAVIKFVNGEEENANSK